MPINKGKIPVDLAAGVVGNWKETYRWIPIFGAIAAFAMSFSAGANNLPASVRQFFIIYIDLITCLCIALLCI